MVSTWLTLHLLRGKRMGDSKIKIVIQTEEDHFGQSQLPFLFNHIDLIEIVLFDLVHVFIFENTFTLGAIFPEYDFGQIASFSRAVREKSLHVFYGNSQVWITLVMNQAHLFGLLPGKQLYLIEPRV